MKNVHPKTHINIYSAKVVLITKNSQNTEIYSYSVIGKVHNYSVQFLLNQKWILK